MKRIFLIAAIGTLALSNAGAVAHPRAEQTEPLPSPPQIARQANESFLYGAATDRPLCWVAKVKREGQAFRIYFTDRHPQPMISSPSRDTVVAAVTAEIGQEGASVKIKQGQRLMLSNNPHDGCAAQITRNKGRLAVKLNQWFSMH